MEAFFAYRLPGEKRPVFLKGPLEVIPSLSSADPTGILFHSFLGDQILQLLNPVGIQPEDFRCIHLEEPFISWKKEEYLNAFERVQRAIREEDYKKLILSRIKEIPTAKKPLDIFHDLNQTYAGTFNYVFSSVLTGTWMGATPELLLQSNGQHISTVSLAGTKPADGLSVWTTKEKEEQKLVTDFIVDTLKKVPVENLFVSEPFTSPAGPVEHLKTEISAKIKTTHEVMKIVDLLHPTPATCGIPQQEAKIKITAVESHQRKFYTGFIGILEENQSRFFVNLRCMELQPEKALLYVGGGITSSSIGEREWIETERKAETLASVLK